MSGECPTCGRRSGGPFTPSEFTQFAVPAEERPRDPRLVAAELVRDEARAAFDAVDAVHSRRVRESTVAEIHGKGTPADRQQLLDAITTAKEGRTAAWARVVTANDAVRAAVLQVEHEARVAVTRG